MLSYIRLHLKYNFMKYDLLKYSEVSMKKSYIAAIAAGAVVIALGAYFYSYRDKYYPGTTIDNINVRVSL